MKIFILILVLLLPLSMLKAEDGVKKKIDIFKEARKKHPKKLDFLIKKNDTIIGYRKLNESQIVPGLDQFLDELRKIVKNRDTEGLSKLTGPEFGCWDLEGPPKQDFDYCIKYLKLEKKESWDQLLHTLNSGGCVNSSRFLMPGLLECTSTRDNDWNSVPSDYYIKDAEMRVYEKLDAESDYQILRANHFYKEIKNFSSKEAVCHKKTCPTWSLISAKSGLRGYISGDILWSHVGRYKYHIMIKHDGSKFFISYMGFRFIL